MATIKLQVQLPLQRACMQSGLKCAGLLCCSVGQVQVFSCFPSEWPPQDKLLLFILGICLHVV